MLHVLFDELGKLWRERVWPLLIHYRLPVELKGFSTAEIPLDMKLGAIANKNTFINGFRIAYGCYGPKAGQPVVFLHGTPSSSLIFREVVPYLTNAGYQVYLFDQLGYGVSERPWDPSIDTSMTSQIPILRELLAFWDIRDKFHLVAHDIGGGIAQRYAVLYPQRLRSLTLIDVVSFDSYPSQRTREQMKAGLDMLINADDKTHRAHFREWLLSAVQNKEKFTEGSLETFLHYISGPLGQASLFQHQVRHYNPKHTMEIADRLHLLSSTPVQLIWGEKDSWQTLKWAHKLNEAIPGSKLQIIPDCGHFSPEDKPQAVASHLLSFINENPE